jgi:hypothetical protein
MTRLPVSLLLAIACTSGQDQRVELGQLDARVRALEDSVRWFRLTMSLQQLRRDVYKTATFDPAAGEGFSRLDTSVGSLVVSIQQVTPFADGVRVRLHIGNLTSATINGGTMKVKWGSRMPELFADSTGAAYDRWSKSLKEREVKFLETLQPGTWNNVNLTLPGTPPTQFGYLNLEMEVQNISMRVR